MNSQSTITEDEDEPTSDTKLFMKEKKFFRLPDII